jgi:N-acetylglucosamine transport system permease protein
MSAVHAAKNSAGTGVRWSRVLLYAGLIIYAAIVIYPMLWLVSTSLKDSWSIFQNPWALPEVLRWDNYTNAWTKGMLGAKFWNSAVIDVVSLALILLVSAMAAYVLARFDFRGNRVLFFMFLGGMALPVFLGIIPLFRLMHQINLWDTRVGLIVVYVSYSLPFTIFILSGFFRTLPNQLAEAAAIDGSSPFGTFWRIMLPLAKPGLVTAGIFVFIGLWNEYPLALVLMANEKLHTLPLGIANLTMTQKYQADWGALFAALTIGILPTVILYSIFQKQIQAGLTAGAIKG